MRAKTKKRTTKKKLFQFHNWLLQKIRRISYQYPPRKEAIKRGRVSRGKYRCAICLGENFGPKDIQLDHINPVIDPHNGFQDWNTYIERLFCDTEGWQIVCKACHLVKSSYENEIRKQVKRSNRKEEEDI